MLLLVAATPPFNYLQDSHSRIAMAGQPVLSRAADSARRPHGTWISGGYIDGRPKPLVRSYLRVSGRRELCGGGNQRPRQKCASRALRLFLKFLIQTLVKTIGRSENPFIPVNRDKIAHSVEQRGAIATLGKVPVKRRPLRRIQFVVDIVRNIPPDVLAVYSHSFLTSFESHPRPPSWPSPGARMSPCWEYRWER